MNNTKRIISMLLALVMVLSLAVMGVSAESTWGGMTDIAAPTEGNGSEANPFIIDTPQKLAWISAMVEDGTAGDAFMEEVTGASWSWENRKAFQGVYFKQTADIDLGGLAFMPIGSYMSATSANRRLFAGVYDGNGYEIQNAVINMADHVAQDYYLLPEVADTHTPPSVDLYSVEAIPGHYDALFNLSSGAVIKNVNAVNIDTGNYDAEHTASTAAGVIAGFMIDATIQNCTTDAACSATAKYAGGIAVRTWGNGVSKILDNTNAATVNGAYAGGIAMMPFYAGDTVTGNTNNGAVNGTTYAGGIVASTKANLSGCTNNGAITGAVTGGIVPIITTSLSIVNCTNNGAITGTGVTGGIIGDLAGNVTVSGCVNTANGVVNAVDYAGGIVGHIGAVVVTISDCANHAAVTSTKTNYHGRVGGIVGCANQPTAKTITNCVNTGAITSYGAAAAGIIGYLRGESTVSNCVNSGAIETKVANCAAAGIVGEMDNTEPKVDDPETTETNEYVAPSGRKTVTNCLNTAAITGVTYAGGIVGVMAGATVTWCVNQGDLTTVATDTVNRVRHALGGIAASAVQCKADTEGNFMLNYISYCVNGADASISATANYDAGMGGILGGTMGKAGQWTDGTISVQFSHCYNLMTSMTFTSLAASMNAAGSGIVGYTCDRAANGTDNSWDHCYSVAGKVVTTNNADTPGEVAWNHGAVHSGIISATVGAGQITNCFGSSDAFLAKITNCDTDMTVAEIEALSEFKAIIAATPADDSENIKFIGVQDSLIKGDTYDVRFIAGLTIDDVALANYTAAGFQVKITSAAGTMAEYATFTDAKIYSQLIGINAGNVMTYDAANYGVTYFAALTISDINLAQHGAVTFEIIPVLMNGNAVAAQGAGYVVNYDAKGNFVSCEAAA